MKNWLSNLKRRKTQPARIVEGKPLSRAVCISMVRNEQDIIEPFLRHNQKYFDAMVVLDNTSVDKTRDIALSCARELGNIVVTDLPDQKYAQSQFMTEALWSVQSAFFADFVCFLDADEFISLPDREAFLKSVENIPSRSCVSLPWRTYQLNPEEAEESESLDLKHFDWRRKVENPQYFKVFPRLGGAIFQDLEMADGNHSARQNSGGHWSAHQVPELHLNHFPVRSSEQLLTKSAIGSKMIKALNDSSELLAFQWKKVAAAYGETKGLSSEELAQEAMKYAQDEPFLEWRSNIVQESHGVSDLRKHSDGRYGDPAAMLSEQSRVSERSNQVLELPKRKTVDQSKADVENAFDAAWHWDYFFLDAAPFRFVYEKYQPTSLLDVGCGNGIYLHLAKANGVSDVVGLDGIHVDATVLPESEYQKTDLMEPVDMGRQFDLVMCMEVAEHISPDSMSTLLDSIEVHAKSTILFSMAEPGQPGNGHINCRTMAEVLDLWADRGWYPDLVDTMSFRALSSLSWFRRNTLLLKKAEDGASDEGIRTLKNIGAKDFVWYGQKPGARMFAFKEGRPPADTGYVTAPKKHRKK